MHLGRYCEQRAIAKRLRIRAIRISIPGEKPSRFAPRDAERLSDLLGVDREDEASAASNILEQTMYLSHPERDAWVDHDLNGGVAYSGVHRRKAPRDAPPRSLRQLEHHPDASGPRRVAAATTFRFSRFFRREQSHPHHHDAKRR